MRVVWTGGDKGDANNGDGLRGGEGREGGGGGMLGILTFTLVVAANKSKFLPSDCLRRLR
jgi:hypothetical protein